MEYRFIREYADHIIERFEESTITTEEKEAFVKYIDHVVYLADHLCIITVRECINLLNNCEYWIHDNEHETYHRRKLPYSVTVFFKAEYKGHTITMSDHGTYQVEINKNETIRLFEKLDDAKYYIDHREALESHAAAMGRNPW